MQLKKFRYAMYIDGIAMLKVASVKSEPNNIIVISVNHSFDEAILQAGCGGKGNCRIVAIDEFGAIVKEAKFDYQGVEPLPFDFDYGKSEDCERRYALLDVNYDR